MGLQVRRIPSGEQQRQERESRVRALALEVARKTWGPSIRLVHSEPINRGADNRGIYLHRTSAGHDFIQKLVRKKHELALAQAFIASRNFPELRDAPIVKHLDAVSVGGEHHLFTLRALELGPREGEAKDLVALSHHLQRFFSELEKRFGPFLPESENLSEKARRVFGQFAISEPPELAVVEEILSAVPLVPSHNDLWQANVLRDEETGGLVAIDFGQCGHATAGTDFFDIVKRPDFREGLLDAYANWIGVKNRGDLILAATFKAAVRRLGHDLKKESPSQAISVFTSTLRKVL